MGERKNAYRILVWKTSWKVVICKTEKETEGKYTSFKMDHAEISGNDGTWV
jgi:hypothetical protein